MRTSIVRSWRANTAALLLLMNAAAAHAAEPAKSAAASDGPTKEQLEHRIEELEQDLQQLRKDTRGLEVREEERSKLKPAVEWKDGFRFATPEGDFLLRTDGYVQADGRFFLDEQGAGARSQFLIRRARIDMRATLWKWIDVRLMPDFARSQAVLFDAFVTARFAPEANAWMGKFKPPVGLERLQSALSIRFTERGQPTNLVPNRDVGAMLQGFFFNTALQYQLGVFNGVADGGNGDLDIDDDKDFAGRLFATPFKDTEWEPLRGVGLGVAGTYGNRRGSPSNTGLRPYVTSQGQQTYFQYVANNPSTAAGTAVASGPVSRISPQAYYYWGPFGALGEFANSKTDITLNNIEGSVSNNAWQFYFTYFLTGEDNGFEAPTPINSFNPTVAGSGWGAWELGFRYDGLKVDNDAFTLGFASPTQSANKAQSFTFGLNWYWNRAFKFVLDYGHTIFDGGAPNGGSRENEDVLTIRSQIFY